MAMGFRWLLSSANVVTASGNAVEWDRWRACRKDVNWGVSLGPTLADSLRFFGRFSSILWQILFQTTIVCSTSVEGKIRYVLVQQLEGIFRLWVWCQSVFHVMSEIFLTACVCHALTPWWMPFAWFVVNFVQLVLGINSLLPGSTLRGWVSACHALVDECAGLTFCCVWICNYAGLRMVRTTRIP